MLAIAEPPPTRPATQPAEPQPTSEPHEASTPPATPPKPTYAQQCRAAYAAVVAEPDELEVLLVERKNARRVAEIIRERGLDPEAVWTRIERDEAAEATATKLSADRAECQRLDLEYISRFRWQRLAAEPGFEVKLTRLAETIAVRARMDADICGGLTNRTHLQRLLRARGRKLTHVDPELWGGWEDDSSCQPVLAIVRQFNADLAPLRDALHHYSTVQIEPFNDVPDEAVTSRLASLRADVDALPEVPEKLSRWVGLVHTAVKVWSGEFDERTTNALRHTLKSQLSQLEREVHPGIVQAGHVALGGN